MGGVVEIKLSVEERARSGLPLAEILNVDDILHLAFPELVPPSALRTAHPAAWRSQSSRSREFRRHIRDAILSSELPAISRDEGPDPLRQAIENRSGKPCSARKIVYSVRAQDFATWLPDQLRRLLPDGHHVDAWLGKPETRASAETAPEPFRFRVRRHRDLWAQVLEEVARRFYDREGRNATADEAWVELRMNPPSGCHLRVNTRSVESPEEPRLVRSEFVRRWDNFTKSPL